MTDEGQAVDDLFFDNPTGTQAELLAATYRALCRHGYAGLSLQTIGEEFEKSPSLIYYHYENKDELILETLDAMLDQLEEDLSQHPDDPIASMKTIIGVFDPSESEGLSLERAVVELRGHAPNDEEYRQRFKRADQVLDQRFEQVIRAGIDIGKFSHPEPEAAAKSINTLLIGTMVRRSSSENGEWVKEVRSEVEQLLGITPSILEE